MDLAPAHQPAPPARDLLRDDQPGGLRPDAARPRVLELRGPRVALRGAAQRVDRTEGQMGPGPRRADPDPDAQRDQRQYRRLLGPGHPPGAAAAVGHRVPHALAEGDRDSPAHVVGDPDPAGPRLRARPGQRHRFHDRLRGACAQEAAGRREARGRIHGRWQREDPREHHLPQRGDRRMARGAAAAARRRQEAGRAARSPAQRHRDGVGNLELPAPARVTMDTPLQPPSPHAPPLAQRHGRACIVTTPPLNRTPMAPQRWTRSLLRRIFGERRRPGAESEAADGPWHRTASLRRACLVSLVLVQTAVGTDFMASVLPYQGRQPLATAILVLFAILCAWISAGFWTAIAGFFVLMRGGDRHAISRTAATDAPIGPDARTAIVMPIFNENVAQVFGNIRAIYESLERAGRLHHFDFFVLSDSSDPDICVAEMHGWLELNRAVGGFGRIYYRRRQHRIKRKSGNIADFCRRWGRNYRYMVVLDADSVMASSCLTRLVQLMEANPTAGIIQTVPVAAGRETLYARIQQFASRAYGPLYSAGLHFWQLGESHYWG